MVEYDVEISPLFKEELENLDNGIRKMAKKALLSLPNRNHKNHSLKHELVGFYSHHFYKNKYRIIYTIEDHILKILAISIGKRDDKFYDKIKECVEEMKQQKQS